MSRIIKLLFVLLVLLRNHADVQEEAIFDFSNMQNNCVLFSFYVYEPYYMLYFRHCTIRLYISSFYSLHDVVSSNPSNKVPSLTHSHPRTLIPR